MWVADSNDDKIYACSLATKARDQNKDFNTLVAAGNTSFGGIWSDGTTMWVADGGNDKIFAYSLATKVRDPNRDFNILGIAVLQGSMMIPWGFIMSAVGGATRGNAGFTILPIKKSSAIGSDDAKALNVQYAIHDLSGELTLHLYGNDPLAQPLSLIHI